MSVEPANPKSNSKKQWPPRFYRLWRKTWADQMHRPLIRWFAYLELYLFDHGFLRPFYNRPELVADGVYRSAQPSPAVIRKLAGQGFCTIVSLRGTGLNGTSLLAAEACRQTGLTLHCLKMKSRQAPSIDMIRQLTDIVGKARKPMLLHCKSGADRSGIAAAICLLLADSNAIAAAQRQLSWRYLHVRQARTGILDAFLQEYADFRADHDITFMEWVEHHYDPKALQATFKPRGWANWLVDGLLRRE